MTSIDVRPRLAKLGSLTGLRFYAALVVLLKHAVAPILPAPLLLQLSAVGPIGVGFFFVLSGFVLTWSWKPATQSREFYIRRAARIVPLHVLTMALAMAVLLANGTPHWVSSILSLVLLQAWLTEPYRIGGNTPSWSLSCEAFFYACFPALMRRLATTSIKGCFRVILVAFVGMVLWNLAYGGLTLIDMPAVTALSTYTNPAYRIGEFIIGIAVGIAIRQGWRSRISLPTALIFGAVGYVGLALINHVVVSLGARLGGAPGIPLGLLDLMYLPITVVLVAAAATSDIEGRKSPIAGKWHIRLGEWSFALYLIQAVVIGLVAEAVDPSWPWWVSAATLVATMTVCVAFSAALFNWVEKPAEAFISHRFAAGRPEPVKVEAAS